MGNAVAECQNTWSVDIIYKISIPKEYDGLCLYLYLPGSTEYKEPREELSEAFPQPLSKLFQCVFLPALIQANRFLYSRRYISNTSSPLRI